MHEKRNRLWKVEGRTFYWLLKEVTRYRFQVLGISLRYWVLVSGTGYQSQVLENEALAADDQGVIRVMRVAMPGMPRPLQTT